MKDVIILILFITALMAYNPNTSDSKGFNAIQNTASQYWVPSIDERQALVQ